MERVNQPEQPAAANRPQPLKRMFDAVPRRYDVLNRVLTLGFDEPWRGRAARLLLEGDPAKVLDICCGTGDLTLQLARRRTAATEVTGLDFAPEMLEVARQKAARLPLTQQPGFVEGDASALPYPDGEYDAVGVAFGFRNVTWRNHLRDGVLSEVKRVLRPGGRFVVVETSQPVNPLLRWADHTYLRLVAAPVGTWISGHPTAYRYLAESACAYYNAEEVQEMLLGAGFSEVTYTRLLWGVAALHVAVK